jgi:cysteine desulfurase
MWQKNVHYLDYNASAGVSHSVRDRLISFLKDEELFLANPSSRHRPGQKMQHLIYEASLAVARTLGDAASPDDLVWVSSGTEANQTVLRYLERTVEGMIIGSGEHSASHDLLEGLGVSFKAELPLLPEGTYDLVRLAELLSHARDRGLRSIGLSLFWANNETGVLTPLAALSRIIRDSGIEVRLHLDGAQVWGKIPLDVLATPADYITFSAHKIGAPAGSGIIWKRPGAGFRPLFTGTQNGGLRGGTENLLGMMATRFACENLDPVDFQHKTGVLQKQLEEGLVQLDPSIQIWGWQERRISNTTRFSFKQFQSYENWIELLDLRGFAVSHGSACKARVIEPSRVLLAMGASREAALNSIRVSFGPSNQAEEVEGFLAALSGILDQKGRAS